MRSGIVEELDKRQAALLGLVYARVVHYYRDLYRTRPCYQYPLSMSRLTKLCRRSGATVTQAVRLLANTVPYGSNGTPSIVYDRIPSEKNPAHRPYRIWLRKENGTVRTRPLPLTNTGLEK